VAVKKKRSAGKKAAPKRKATTKKKQPAKSAKAKEPRKTALQLIESVKPPVSTQEITKRGRPTVYSELIEHEICARLADGEPLRQICRDERMPAWQTVYLWMSKDEGINRRIARARVMGFDAIAEDALHIADTPTVGETIRASDKDGMVITQEDMLGHRKLQVETRLKLLAKWDPKRYGERPKEDGGDDPLAVLYTSIVQAGLKQGPGIVYDDLTDSANDGSDNGDSGPETY